MYLLPKINGEFEEAEGTLRLSQNLIMPGTYPEIDRVFEERMGTLDGLSGEEESVHISYVPTAMEPEAYRLEIKDHGVVVSASGSQGYSNALTTLFQLSAQGMGILPCCVLTDFPRFSWRGLMLDVCRHFYSVAEIKKILEQCALLKMNKFHWHLSDDQGFRVESKRFPDLNRISSYRILSPDDPLVVQGKAKAGELYGGYYTQDEIREIIAFAGARQIEIIPELEVPGHSSAILAAFPQYTCSGEPLRVKNTFGVHERIFCPGNEDVFDFLKNLLDEFFTLFPSQYIHLGGDEAPKRVWHDCPKCNRVIEREKLNNFEELQAYFTGKLVTYCKEHNRIPIVWNESAASGKLSSTAVVQYWAELAPGPSYIAPELEKGRSLILSDGNIFYCSNSYAEMPLRASLCYEPNVKGVPVPDQNVLGVEAAMWTEWAPLYSDIEVQLYPRLLAVAECGWSRERAYEDFEPRAKRYLEVKALNVLTPMSWPEATVHGEKALRMIAQGMLELSRKYRGMSSGDAGEAAGKAEAVVPDGSQSLDMSLAVRNHMEEKMRGVYTPEEIEQVIQMIMNSLGA